jgi:hypothetical protein
MILNQYVIYKTCGVESIKVDAPGGLYVTRKQKIRKTAIFAEVQLLCSYRKGIRGTELWRRESVYRAVCRLGARGFSHVLSFSECGHCSF